MKLKERIEHWIERRFGIHVENGRGWIDHGGCIEIVGKPRGRPPKTPEPDYKKDKQTPSYII